MRLLEVFPIVSAIDRVRDTDIKDTLYFLGKVVPLWSSPFAPTYYKDISITSKTM